MDHSQNEHRYCLLFILYIFFVVIGGCRKSSGLLQAELEKDFSPPIFSEEEQIDPNLELSIEETRQIDITEDIAVYVQDSSHEQVLKNDPNTLTDQIINYETFQKTEETDKNQKDLDESLRLCQEAQNIWREGHPDQALERLDKANELLARVNIDNDPTLTQEKDDIRFLISKRIVEIYASRQTMVNGNHNEIPYVINQYVEEELNNFIKKGKESFLVSYRRSGKYRPMILAKLKEAGLPPELSWLPLIESRFNEKAFSKARALGLWQFIPSTGYKFGLIRDNWIDERMDPGKSTIAAIDYLTQLHKIFGEWTTALAAYNCGEGTVLKIIRTQHVNYLDNFWDLYEKLPRETARYVPKFLAVLHIIKNPKKYGFILDELEKPFEYEKVKINKQVSFSDLSPKINIDQKILVSLNPELRYKITPNYSYSLKVPIGYKDKILMAIDSISPWKPRYVSFKYYRVKKGDSLSKIARRNRVSLKSILTINGLENPHKLSIGQRIKIPSTTKKRLSARSKSKKINTGLYKEYIVKKGDSPSKIAKVHNMKLKKFIRINRLTSQSIIYPGQIVLIE